MTRAHLMVTAAALAILSPIAGVAEDHDAPLYVSVDCMKSRAPDYVQLEIETWLPMHQQLVNEGKRVSWALYQVTYGDRSRCDYYTVTTFLGAKHLSGQEDYGRVLAEVQPRANADRVFARTLAARERVSTELWLRIDRTEIRPHRHVIVNRMYAEDPIAYERMESDVFKAGHEALMKGGYRAGWAIYSLVAPIGSSIPYNYGTVDFVNDLGPVPMAEAMMAGNPDRDLDAMHELLELREHILSETWSLVAATVAAD